MLTKFSNTFYTTYCEISLSEFLLGDLVSDVGVRPRNLKCPRGLIRAWLKYLDYTMRDCCVESVNRQNTFKNMMGNGERWRWLGINLRESQFPQLLYSYRRFLEQWFLLQLPLRYLQLSEPPLTPQHSRITLLATKFQISSLLSAPMVRGHQRGAKK